MTAHRTRSRHPELRWDNLHAGSNSVSPNALERRIREHIITEDSTWPIDDLALGVYKVPPAARGTFAAPPNLEVQPLKVTGKRIGVEELHDQVL